jgi:hypothetical protein
VVLGLQPGVPGHAEADDAAGIVAAYHADDEGALGGQHADGRAKRGRRAFGWLRLRERVDEIGGRPRGFAEQPVDRQGVAGGADAQRRRRRILTEEGARDQRGDDTDRHHPPARHRDA